MHYTNNGLKSMYTYFLLHLAVVRKMCCYYPTALQKITTQTSEAALPGNVGHLRN